MNKVFSVWFIYFTEFLLLHKATLIFRGIIFIIHKLLEQVALQTGYPLGTDVISTSSFDLHLVDLSTNVKSTKK